MEAVLRNRYYFRGTLVLDTALHIGGRNESPLTKSPVIRTADDRSFIPGSSFKGAFRAAVERIVADKFTTLRCCVLYSLPEAGCLATDPKLAAEYEALRERGDDRALATFLDQHLCAGCRLFGSPFAAGKVFFADLPILEPWAGVTEIRDGVGLDRDTDRAVDEIKFDFEVVPAGSRFAFTMTVENAEESDLELLAIGLNEFGQGLVPLGGIRSRGLGRCHLELEAVESVHFDQPESFKKYLTRREMDREDPAAFIRRHLDGLLERMVG